MGLFGHTKVDPKKKVNEMSGLLRRESRQIDRQIQTIEREQNKTKMEIKKAAKAGNKEVCKILAKEIINANKAKSKLYQSKAHMNSVMLNMKTQLATIRITGAVEKSTQVMSAMNRLVKIPEIQKTMNEMSKEMMKMGIIEELMEDAMEGLEPEDIEEDADKEVEKVLFELTAGQLGSMPSAQTSDPIRPAAAEEEDEVDDEMLQRLAGLRNA